jgi:hypothetical protein
MGKMKVDISSWKLSALEHLICKFGFLLPVMNIEHGKESHIMSNYRRCRFFGSMTMASFFLYINIFFSFLSLSTITTTTFMSYQKLIAWVSQFLCLLNERSPTDDMKMRCDNCFSSYRLYLIARDDRKKTRNVNLTFLLGDLLIVSESSNRENWD